ncbi:MAG: efflux RND transporter periplasmic adaptor subunit [Pirellulales bacterium]
MISQTVVAPRVSMALWVAALTLCVGLAGCGDDAIHDGTGTEPDLAAVEVEVAEATLTTLHPTLELVGTIVAVPEQTAMVSPQLGGWVETLAVVEGQTVEAGRLLVQLDDRSARTDVQRAAAVVAEKQAALRRLKRGYLPQEIETARQDRDKAQATVDGLRSELGALDDLLKHGEISPVAYETKAKALAAAEAALASADAHFKLIEAGTPTELVDEAQSLLDVALADLKHAQLVLEWCSITSPIDGVVVQLLAHKGQFFDRAMPLATVIDMSTVFVQFRLPSQRSNEVRAGTQVEVSCDSFPEEAFRGNVARISGQADPLTGNIVVFASMDNHDGRLRPGLSCRARIALPDIPGALVVPVAAVADHSGTPVVTVIRDGLAYETAVQTAAETRDFVQIRDGLSAGDVVAVAGGYGLPAGCPVTIVPAHGPGASQ